MSDSALLPIGTLARRTRCPVPTIRYYEDIGLLPRPARAGNGHRHYREADVARLGFVKRCRDFGFAIEQVRPLLALFEDGERDCSAVRDLARQHLHDVQARIAAMQQLESALSAFIADCDQACVGGPTRDCVIVGAMTQQPAPTGCCAAAAARGPWPEE